MNPDYKYCQIHGGWHSSEVHCEKCICPADVTSDACSGDPPMARDESGLSSNGANSLQQQFEQLLQMHEDLMQALAATIQRLDQAMEQNQEILQSVSDVTQDFDHEPRTYLDGTKI